MSSKAAILTGTSLLSILFVANMSVSQAWPLYEKSCQLHRLWWGLPCDGLVPIHGSSNTLVASCYGNHGKPHWCGPVDKETDLSIRKVLMYNIDIL